MTLEAKGSKPCKALIARNPLQVLTSDGKLGKWSHDFSGV